MMCFLRLEHGDLLVMVGLHQSEYVHRTVSRLQGPRVSLTYRWITQHVASCPPTGAPTHMSHFRTRDFSRVAQDLNHRANRNRCVSQNCHSAHQAQHVARALVVVSFTLEHYLTFHMHAYPTFYSTVNQTFIDVIFTRGFFLALIHRMCLSDPWLKRTRLHTPTGNNL